MQSFVQQGINKVNNDLSASHINAGTKNEPKYITGETGVQENPGAPLEKKEQHTIEPPKVSTQHF